MAVTNVYWGRIGFAGSCVGALALCIAGLLLGGEIEYLIDQGELHALDGKIRTDEELILRGKQNERDLHDQLASTLAELHKQVQLNKKLDEQEHGKGKGQDAGLGNLGAAKSVNLTAVSPPRFVPTLSAVQTHPDAATRPITLDDISPMSRLNNTQDLRCPETAPDPSTRVPRNCTSVEYLPMAADKFLDNQMGLHEEPPIIGAKTPARGCMHRLIVPCALILTGCSLQVVATRGRLWPPRRSIPAKEQSSQ